MRDAWQQPDIAHAAQPPSSTPSSASASKRQTRSVLTAALIAVVTSGLAIAVTNDVIIGVAVGAALSALVDRVVKAWRPDRVEHTRRNHRSCHPWFVHTAWCVHRALYQIGGGRLVWTTSNKRGWGALHLTSVGRKSGRDRIVIIGYLEDGLKLIALAMNGWDEGHPAWWLNLEANPDAAIRLAANSHDRCTYAPPRERSANGSGSAGSRSTRNSTPTPLGARSRHPSSCSSREVHDTRHLHS